MKTFNLDDISIEIVQKNIKNVHLSVHPPHGKVTIAAPLRMDTQTLRVFAISKLSWIRKQQAKIKNQKRETAREYINKENHYYLGKRYLLKVIDTDLRPKVILKHNTIELHVKPNTNTLQRKTILESWYRNKLKELIEEYISNWEKQIKVRVKDFGVRKMKTKWGSCNHNAQRIWLNLELAKKPRHCIEYVVVHEMVHLINRLHDERFVAYMDKFLPQWRAIKRELNELPIGNRGD
ncbi:MAG: M48 family metallopeptidase [Cyanobacteria bacterium REEB446]|nr:M48 family metallopeptidase [Cyanobacteria bacterium REEB446]